MLIVYFELAVDLVAEDIAIGVGGLGFDLRARRRRVVGHPLPTV